MRKVLIGTPWDWFPPQRNEHYFRRYKRLIESRIKIPSVAEYVEKHHIFPVFFERIDSKINMVTLSYREHLLAHKLIWKSFGGRSAFLAYNLMYQLSGNKTQRELAIIRMQKAERLSGKSNPMFGIKRPDLSERNKSDIRRGEHHPWYGKSHTEETKNKISVATQGRGLGSSNPEQSDRMKGAGNPMFGKKNEGHAARLRALQATPATCDKCGKSGSYPIMKRWHFERCSYA